MKKLKVFRGFLFVALCFFMANNSTAQGSYVNLNVGYAFPLSAGTMEDFYNYSHQENSSTYEQVCFSMGKGVNFGGTFGYMFNKHVGAELGLSYLLGSKVKFQDKYNESVTDISVASNMFRVIPSIVIAAGTENINPYAKFGVVIGVGSICMEYEYSGSGGDIEILKSTLNGGVAIGINSAVGAIFELSDKFSIFGELNAVNMSYAPTKGELTEATYNGVDNLADMTTQEKEIEFVDKYTYDYNNPPPDSEPRKELKHKFPYGSFGINVGVVLYL